jgi:hypothetical protein
MEEILDPQISVKVIASQWFWHYELGNLGLAWDSYMISENELKNGDLRLLTVDNPLFIPVETTIRLLITSNDVIHSFSIPSLGLKVDAVPGRLNQLSTYISRTGIYYGQCSELCGVNHGFMPIEVITLSSVSFSIFSNIIRIPYIIVEKLMKTCLVFSGDLKIIPGFLSLLNLIIILRISSVISLILLLITSFFVNYIITFIIEKFKVFFNNKVLIVHNYLKYWNPKGPLRKIIFYYFNYILFIRAMFEYTIVFMLFTNLFSILLFLNIFFHLLTMGKIIIIIFYLGSYLLFIDIYGEILSALLHTETPHNIQIIKEYKTYLTKRLITNNIIKRFIITHVLKYIGISQASTAAKITLVTGAVGGLGWMTNEQFNRMHKSHQNALDRAHQASESAAARAENALTRQENAIQRTHELELARLKASQDSKNNPFKGPFSK